MTEANLPKHLAVIMDGNGRWAKERNHSRLYGHVRGARVAKKLIENCVNSGIENLTLYAFSTENWFRPVEEVKFLMRLLIRQLRREKRNLIKNNVRFHCIGQMDRLPAEVIVALKETMSETNSCTGMNLVFALSYGGRQEICAAAKKLAQQVAAGILDPNDIDQSLLSSQMESSFLPDPELIIRTSGEHRLSNFYLWQAAYSELYLCQKYWPDFSAQDLKEALEFYSVRERRFGKTSEQIEEQKEEQKEKTAASASPL